MNVLIIEDDRTIAENLYDYLELRGHQCEFAINVAAGMRLLEARGFDACVLDRNLPDGDGLALLRRARTLGLNLPTLVLTARDTLDDKLLGFEAGADDYLIKPFALQEVEARLLALCRRSVVTASNPAKLRLGTLVYDPIAKSVCSDEHTLTLPPKALALLAELMAQPGRVFSRRELELLVWGHEQDSSDNLRSMLHTVRKALTGVPAIEIINVHGLGYKIVSH